MKKTILLIAIMIFSSTFIVMAQEEEEEEKSPFSISGSVDAYFRANLTTKNKSDGYDAPGTSFAQLPGFSLGMVNLIAGYEGEKVGFVGDLVFGPRGTEAVFGSDPNSSANIINQLYAYWNVSDKVTLTLGNFNTFLGYEVISPASNFNYSTSYMFSYGPFSHTGVKADFALSENISGMVSIMNPTDLTEFNPFGSYTLGAQLGYSNDNGSIYFNFLLGDQDGKLDADLITGSTTSAGTTFQFDVTTGWDISDKVYAGVNTTINNTGAGEIFDINNGQTIKDADGDGSGFYGLAGYLQLQASETFAIGTRIEYFSEFNGGVGAIGALDQDGDGSVLDVTLSGNIKVGQLTLIPEIRLDATSEERFLDNNLNATKSLASFLLAAVFSF